MLSKMRELMMKESDVTTVVRIINEYRRTFEFSIMDDEGIEDDSKLWTVGFGATEKQYKNICKELNELGKITAIVDEEGSISLSFERTEKQESEAA